MALETLGAVCAVGQLAGQCVYVLDIVGKIRRSTEILKEYQAQLQHLRVLCEAIESNPLLRTTEIISHTQSILDTTQQHDYLPLLLQKRRLYRIWAFLRVERRLLEHTKKIEALKSTLAISIQDQQCRILDNIDKRTQTTAIMATVEEQYDDVKISRGSAIFNGGSGDVPLRGSMELVRRKSLGVQTIESSTGMFRESRANVGVSLSSWSNNTAGAGVNQHNGSSFKGEVRESVIHAENQVWNHNEKDGQGKQQNGFHFKGSDDSHVPTTTVLGGKWEFNAHTNDHSQGRTTGTQHNGHVYEAGPKRKKHGRSHKNSD